MVVCNIFGTQETINTPCVEEWRRLSSEHEYKKIQTNSNVKGHGNINVLLYSPVIPPLSWSQRHYCNLTKDGQQCSKDEKHDSLRNDHGHFVKCVNELQ